MRDWVRKFETGEYLREFRGYEPHWAGCFYGNDKVLNNDILKYTHCFGFFSGTCFNCIVDPFIVV